MKKSHMNRRLQLRHFLLVFFLTSWPGWVFAAASGTPASSPQTIAHILDYVSGDYGGAVANGKIVNEDEYKEMSEFSAQVVRDLQQLPDHPRKAELLNSSRNLVRLVAEKSPADAVSKTANELRWAMVAAYKVQIAPKRIPDIQAAAAAYEQQCAACHGREGKGDGPAARGLKPPPSSFHDARRMATRSVYGLYNTITLGVRGTAMKPFAGLSEEERWGLAFYVAGFDSQSDAQQGAALWKAGSMKESWSSLATLTALSPDETLQRMGSQGAAVRAYLLAHPEALAVDKESSIAFSMLELDEAMRLYRGGDRGRAQQRAVAAYLEGFELVEGALRNLDPELTANTERQMMALRAAISQSASVAEVERQYEATVRLLRAAEERLSGPRLSAGATFASAFLILFREGLEAILVLAAIIAFLVRSNRRDALPYIHAGWAAALALGFATWWVAQSLITISGANREMTEGITALVSVVILLYVGFWLHNNASARRWQAFIRERVSVALGAQTLWAMALVSFLAVYREIFETVLFYQALLAQAERGSHTALFGGVASAAVALFAVGWAIFKYSQRLPLRLFFSATAVLLAVLAVVFAGQGIAALQEAGHVPATLVAHFSSWPAIGLFPTAQTLAAQAIVLATVVVSFYLTRRTGHSKQA